MVSYFTVFFQQETDTAHQYFLFFCLDQGIRRISVAQIDSGKSFIINHMALNVDVNRQ